MGFNRWACFALLSLLACQRAPQAAQLEPPARAAQDTAPQAAVPVVGPVRVVVQPAKLGNFLGIAEGDRFALFSDGFVLDLAQNKVVRQIGGELRALRAGRDQVVFGESGGPRYGDSIAGRGHITSLLTGHAQLLEGELVPHAQLPENLVALRDGPTLSLFDVVSRAVVARFTTTLPAHSVALSADGTALYVSAWNRERQDDDEHALDHWVELFRFGDAAPSGEPRAPYARNEWKYRDFGELPDFDGAIIRTAPARIYSMDDGSFVIGHRSGCPQCRMLAPYVHVWRALDTQTAKPSGAWSGRYFSDVAEGSRESRAWFPNEKRVMPERVQRAIAAAQGVGTGRLHAPCRGEACFFTLDAHHLCAWSIAQARPIGCKRHQADGQCMTPVHMLDGDHAFLIGCARGQHVELTHWSARTGQAVTRRFATDWGLSYSPILFAPEGLRFLVHDGPRVEAWTWGRDAADWRYEGCLGPLQWTPDGRKVICPLAEHYFNGPLLVVELDAQSGRALGAKQPMPAFVAPPYPALPCAMRVDGDAIYDGARLVAHLYVFDDGEHALVLPSGEHSASPGARKHLAFVAADGHVLDDRQIDALHRPQEVRAQLAPLTRCAK